MHHVPWRSVINLKVSMHMFALIMVQSSTQEMKVQVQGPEIMAPFGEIVRENRDAIILRASFLERLWTKAFGDFEVMELCEFSFSEEATL